jgi:hypothetical protein
MRKFGKLIFLVWIALLNSSSGAIIYRQLLPGEILDNTGTALVNNIDLNGDGVIDFFTTNGGDEAVLVPVGENRIFSFIATLPDLGRSIAPLRDGGVIGPVSSGSPTWTGIADRINRFDDGESSIYRCNGRGGVGNPADCNSSIPANELVYVGLEVNEGGEVNYGWVEISSSLNVLHTVRVSGFAYENEPGVPIMAGAIPEPSSIFLAFVSGTMLLRRKR